VGVRWGYLTSNLCTPMGKRKRSGVILNGGKRERKRKKRSLEHNDKNDGKKARQDA